MFGLVAFWILFLAGLALWTANPVTLNRDQILLAQATGAVVIADIRDVRSGRIHVTDVLCEAPELPVEINAGK